MVNTNDYRVLVPVDVLGGQDISRTLVEAFASVPVVLLGYHEIPDQTAPSQARAEFGETARSELSDHHAVFEAAGCDVTSKLVFTHRPLKTFERSAVLLDCDAVLLLNPAPVLDRILVAIRGDVNVERIARLVGAIVADTEIAVTFFHVIANEAHREDGETLVETGASALVEAGVDPNRVESNVVGNGSPIEAILDVAGEYDLFVVGESRPSIRRFVFRDRAKKIARRTVDPVLVVRGDYLDAADEAIELPGDEKLL
ncbi:universal stress protein [Halorientalis brevis]|uniref:Universal stress protein n=1 Tax=Halorientalis brevis TaxID=1126241 RepID=A0ABD6CA75_9EURY|nr:universal stress protein [Halorientalis brevis]